MNLRNVLSLLVMVFMLGCMKDTETDQQKQMKRDDELVQKYIQDNQIKAERDAVGFYYAPLVENPEGKAVESKDIVEFRYKISLLNGEKVEDKSSESDTLRKAMHNYVAGYGNYNRALFPASLDWGLGYMKKGEKFLFVIPSYLAWGDAYLPGKFPANANFAIEIEVTDILSLEEQKKVEKELIEAYIAEHELEGVQGLPSGLHYYKREEGSGDAPEKGQRVQVQYKGTLLNGKEFDKSDPKKPYDFYLGREQVIKGWDEGIGLMKEGEKATLIIPSHLAYGQSVLVLPEAVSAIAISPFSVLIFEVELVDIL